MYIVYCAKSPHSHDLDNHDNHDKNKGDHQMNVCEVLMFWSAGTPSRTSPTAHKKRSTEYTFILIIDPFSGDHINSGHDDGDYQQPIVPICCNNNWLYNIICLPFMVAIIWPMRWPCLAQGTALSMFMIIVITLF